MGEVVHSLNDIYEQRSHGRLVGVLSNGATTVEGFTETQVSGWGVALRDEAELNLAVLTGNLVAYIAVFHGFILPPPDSNDPPAVREEKNARANAVLRRAIEVGACGTPFDSDTFKAKVTADTANADQT
jgi:hypothetical protein